MYPISPKAIHTSNIRFIKHNNHIIPPRSSRPSLSKIIKNSTLPSTHNRLEPEMCPIGPRAASTRPTTIWNIHCVCVIYFDLNIFHVYYTECTDIFDSGRRLFLLLRARNNQARRVEITNTDERSYLRTWTGEQRPPRPPTTDTAPRVTWSTCAHTLVAVTVVADEKTERPRVITRRRGRKRNGRRNGKKEKEKNALSFDRKSSLLSPSSAADGFRGITFP